MISLILIAFLALGLIGSVMERLKWNDGVCKETGKPWILFDKDSQGGSGYKSDNHVCWVSWPMIIKELKED